MLRIFTICIQATEAFGFRLVDERRKLEDNISEERNYNFAGTRARVSEIRPWAKEKLGLLEVGDVLCQVGHKGANMEIWHWEMVSGIPFEKVITTITEAKRGGGKVLLKFLRPDFNSSQEGSWLPRMGISDYDEGLTPDIQTKENATVKTSSSSVRVGQAFQCDFLPIMKSKEYVDERDRSNGDEVFSSSKISSDNLSQYLTELFARSSDLAEEQEKALNCLHNSQYDPILATEIYRNEAVTADLWGSESKQAFENAIRKVRCRDFRAIRDEIGPSFKVSEIVSMYYTKWKCSEAYRMWRTDLKAKLQPIRKCERCLEDDPYEDSIICSACVEYFCHLECMEPPIVQMMPTSSAWKDWKCSKCSKFTSLKHPSLIQTPFIIKSNHVRKQSEYVSTGKLGSASQRPPPPPPPPPQAPELPAYHVISSARKSAAAAAANIWAMNLDDRRSKRKIYTEESFSDLDEDDEYGSKRKHKKVRTGDAGRKLHHLKGAVIDPDTLVQLVEAKGGYDVVVAKKLWQDIRKEMNLKHTTSSSSQLKDAYLAYVEYNNKVEGTAEV
jgi:hypothetical protein